MFDPPSATIYRFPVAEKPVSISATEEAGSIALTGAGYSNIKEPARSFLDSGRRNLREEEIDSPAARRFLIAEIERLDQVCAELDSYKDQYHDQRVELTQLRAEKTKSIFHEILSTFCISVGFAGLGAAPNYLAVAGAERFVLIVIGLSAVLVAGGFITKAWK